MSLCRLRPTRLLTKHLRQCLAMSLRRESSGVRVRFGPSPTGFIHLGGLRTALYNYLYAKQHNGSFVLRIEDTDQERVVPGSQRNLEDMLQWTGLIPDEGPTTGGQYGPYVQSQRIDLYREKVTELLSTPMAYRCFCSDMRLDLLRKEKLKNREIPKYDNRCRHLSQREIDEKLANGEKFAIRLKLKSGPIGFDDIVFGRLSFDLSAIESDPVIFKSDGFPTYHFANVVDDHYMKISHVLRGAEWQVSTPKHIMLYEAFGWTAPKFAHLPLIMNTDGSKLSKRQNDIRIDYYRDNGYYSETIINYLTTIGSGFPHRLEDRIDGLQELTKLFDLTKVNTSNGKIETDKLRLYNRFSIYWYFNNGFENKLIEELKTLLISKFGSTRELNLDNDYLKFLITWSKERIFTLKELLNEEFIYLWKVPDFKWKVSDIATHEEFGKNLIMN
ncbi:unnamed protein product [Oppiella nova]|uniref:Nondiscriminating glutamyl-tRNA synthetase EARS2, mitochondrial n=1 Tax=Oppiella nova TaxID=334625 RepID=A0A7R9LCS3_9ACAR|nr:unnamed protein product [Oppiella nova]CAG2162308.1 unnamed protein product [Oppiella nova]